MTAHKRRCLLSDFEAKCTKVDFGWGFAPDPTGGTYGTPDPQLDLRALLLDGRAGKGRGGRGGAIFSPNIYLKSAPLDSTTGYFFEAETSVASF